MYSGGAVYNDGTLTVESSTFFANALQRSGRGGAIFSDGVATISRSLITHNEASDGAVSNYGDMRISQSTLVANQGHYSGAIDNRGWLAIERSIIRDNVASLGSAGIASVGPTSRLVISDSSMIGNRANQYGGGITAWGTVILTHVTIVGNVAAEGAGIYRHEAFGGLVILRNSIVAGNSGGDCTVGLHENVNSIIGDGSCDAPISGDPVLEWTGNGYAPAAGSPALGAGDPLYCASVDQNGTARSAGEPCDIGAVEAPDTVSPLVSVKRPWPTPTPTECTFEDEIIAANTDAPYGACPAGDGADTIVLGNVYISMDPFPLRITSDITIEGNGANIRDYYSRSQLFEVLGGHLTLRNLTLVGGYSPWTGGAIAVLKGRLTLHNVTIRDSSATFGGAIFNDGGEVEISDSRFINNRAIDLGSWDSGNGGAIFNSGALRIDSSLFSANAATEGGAVYNRGAGAHADITNSRFTSNTVTSFGGALANNAVGQMRVAGSLFLDNFATGSQIYPTNPGGGGAIFSVDEIRIQNSTFSRNRAGFGGAIYLDHPKATMEHITVVQNSGGIYAVNHGEEGVIKMFNSLLADNGCYIGENSIVYVSSGNFIEDGSCDADLQGDPVLPPFDAMANTIAPQAGSPAIDAGDPNYCLPVDQVGTPRPRWRGL